MWPFSKKKTRDVVDEQIEDLRAFRDVGEKFNYLGRVCMTTGHFEYVCGLGVIPRLLADYANEHGVIHQIKFRPCELSALKAENQ